MSVDGDRKMELKYKLREGPRIMGGLAGLWENRRITTGVKVGMIESKVVNTVLYEL